MYVFRSRLMKFRHKNFLESKEAQEALVFYGLLEGWILGRRYGWNSVLPQNFALC
jgi:hypothetical protein